MVYFQTQNHNLGKFWRFLQWKILVYFMAIWSISRPFGIMVYFLVILYIFSVLVYCSTKCLHDENDALGIANSFFYLY
jgi:hypothetical protein